MGTLHRVWYHLCIRTRDSFWIQNIIVSLQGIWNPGCIKIYCPTSKLLPYPTTTQPCSVVVQLQESHCMNQIQPLMHCQSQPLKTSWTWPRVCYLLHSTIRLHKHQVCPPKKPSIQQLAATIPATSISTSCTQSSMSWGRRSFAPNLSCINPMLPP